MDRDLEDALTVSSGKHVPIDDLEPYREGLAHRRNEICLDAEPGEAFERLRTLLT
jgi:hypothetical protein